MRDLTTGQEAIACAKMPSLQIVKETDLALCSERLTCLPSVEFKVHGISAMFDGGRLKFHWQLIMSTYLQFSHAV